MLTEIYLITDNYSINGFGEQISLPTEKLIRAKITKNDMLRSSNNDSVDYQISLTFKIRAFEINEKIKKIKFKNKIYKITDINIVFTDAFLNVTEGENE